MKICKKCIITDSFPDISIEDGECTFCKMHAAFPRVKKNLLGRERLFDKITARKGTTYHCVVGLSGGKDSSYALFYIARILGLKPLAVFFDNGFISDIAKENINNICAKLNVDLVICGATKYRLKIMKENVHLSKYTGKLDACVNCENN